MNNLVIQQPTAIAPVIPFQDVERMASAIAISGLFGLKTPEQALALMLLAQAEGMHPATAARDYHIMNGRPAMKADTMLARFQAAGGRVEWRAYTDEKVEGVFTHPNGGSVAVEWTLARAEQAGLRSDTWKKYPRPMLRARVISEGIRTIYPGVLCGMYTPEEVSEMPEKEAKAVTISKTYEHESNAGVIQSESQVFDWDAAEQRIAAFADVTEMRVWLAQERNRMSWKPTDAEYKTLIAACAERAEQIKKNAEESTNEVKV